MTQEDYDYQKKIQEESRKRFGEVLKKIREEKGLSIRKISAQCGLSASYWSYLERGKFGPPSISKIKQIARELGINPDRLLAEAGHFPKSIADAIRSNPNEIESASGNIPKDGPKALLPLVKLGMFDDILNQFGILDAIKMPSKKQFRLLQTILEGLGVSKEEEMEQFQKASEIMELWKKDLDER